MGPRSIERGIGANSQGREVAEGGFNGAALDRARNRAPAPRSAPTAHRFNGAALDRARNPRLLSEQGLTSAEVLQWGRARSSAESPHLPLDHACVQASMGPRSIERGIF